MIERSMLDSHFYILRRQSVPGSGTKNIGSVRQKSALSILTSIRQCYNYVFISLIMFISLYPGVGPHMVPYGFMCKNFQKYLFWLLESEMFQNLF